ncbi:putative transposase [Faustovirus]|nr:putative transposase [Faustovirus]QJX73534.1 putative transposase [Faustovirus]
MNYISMHLFNEQGNLKVDLQRLRKVSEAEKFTRSETGFWNQNCSVIKDKYIDNLTLTNHDNPENVIVSRKILIKPNYLQRKLLMECFHAYRYVYNQAIELIFRILDLSEKTGCKIMPSTIKMAVYKYVKITDDIVPDFVLPLPADSRKEALREAVKNYSTCITHMRRGICKKFLLKHKRRDAMTFRIKTNAIKLEKNKLVIFRDRIIERIRDVAVEREGKCTAKSIKKYNHLRYADIDKGNRSRLSPYLDENGNPTSYPIITYSHGKYYLIVSGTREAEITKDKKEICAIDPGVVNFHTIYDRETTYIEGHKLYETKLQSINQRIDKLVRAKQYVTGAKLKRMRLRELKLRAKVSNIVYDFRHKLASTLCNKYKVILLPKLGIKQVAKHLRRTVNRKLYALSHYKFNELIKQIAQRTGTTVIHCLESYTSKTCGNCGNLQSVDDDRIFRCALCQYVCGRDENACKNILIRTLNNYLLS